MRLIFVVMVAVLGLSVAVLRCHSARDPSSYKGWADKDNGPIPGDKVSARYQSVFASINLNQFSNKVYVGCIITGPRTIICHSTNENDIDYDLVKNMSLRLKPRLVGRDPLALASGARIRRFTGVTYDYLGGSYYKNEVLVKITFDRDFRADVGDNVVNFVTFHNKDTWDKKFVTLSGPNYRCGIHTYDKLPINELEPGSKEYYFVINDPNHDCPPSRTGNFIFATSPMDQQPILVGLAKNPYNQEGDTFTFMPFASTAWMTYKIN